MRRQICWEEKFEDGLKREIRVSFPGGNKIRWQFKSSDRLEWDYNSIPTVEDWSALLLRAERRYNRRRMPFRDLELVRKGHAEASSD